MTSLGLDWAAAFDERLNDVERRTTEALQHRVRCWEFWCARQPDEDQQDLELRLLLVLRPGGKDMGAVSFRWHPGRQRAVPIR